MNAATPPLLESLGTLPDRMDGTPSHASTVRLWQTAQTKEPKCHTALSLSRAGHNITATDNSQFAINLKILKS